MNKEVITSMSVEVSSGGVNKEVITSMSPKNAIGSA